MAAAPPLDRALCLPELTNISNSTYGGGGRLKDKRYRPKPNHIGKYKTLRHRLNAHFQAISAQPALLPGFANGLFADVGSLSELVIVLGNSKDHGLVGSCSRSARLSASAGRLSR